MLQFLEGKKTYIVGAASIGYAWLGVYLGHTDTGTAMQLTQTAIMGMTIRHGITTTLTR